jgi:hypothetical protein
MTSVAARGTGRSDDILGAAVIDARFRENAAQKSIRRNQRVGDQTLARHALIKMRQAPGI